MPLVVLASALTYVAAALSLTGYVGEKLSFSRTVLTQLAASFAGFVTPPAVGGLATNARYLQQGRGAAGGRSRPASGSPRRSTLPRTSSCWSRSPRRRASPRARACRCRAGRSPSSAPLPDSRCSRWPVPGVRRWFAARLLPPLRQALSRLLDLLTTPTKLAQALLGALALNAAYIAALWFSVRAFDGSSGIAAAAVVYLAGAAIGSRPDPGRARRRRGRAVHRPGRGRHAQRRGDQRRPAVPARHLLAAGADSGWESRCTGCAAGTHLTGQRRADGGRHDLHDSPRMAMIAAVRSGTWRGGSPGRPRPGTGR